MTHALEDLLTLQYGPAKLIRSEALAEQRWNVGEKLRECTLFKTLSWDDQLRRKYGVLEKLYGDNKGGFLLGDSLKVALIEGPGVFGLYLIDELQSQEAVMRAFALDPEVCFFMDAANVWFYGLKNDDLFVFDSGTDELAALGPFETALQRVLIEFEEAQ